MCSRAFYDASGATGPFNRVTSVSPTSATTRYCRRTSRRDSTFRIAKHFTYKHGEEQYVKLKYSSSKDDNVTTSLFKTV